MELDLGDGDDVVTAQGGARLIALGGEGNDTLVGAGTARRGDVLDGGAGTDSYTGGLGRDQFILRAGETEDDVITDFEGVGIAQGDVIRLLGFDPGATVAESAPGAYTVQQSGAAAGSFAAAGLITGQDILFA